jgi:hypothetical protein
MSKRCSGGEDHSSRDAMPNTVVGVAASLLDRTSALELPWLGVRFGDGKVLPPRLMICPLLCGV